MSYQVITAAAVVVVYLVVKFLSITDTPKIKGIPEIPGVPIFGNLIQLGTDHARVTKKWAEKYGPVFQTRLGTKVRSRRGRERAREAREEREKIKQISNCRPND